MKLNDFVRELTALCKEELNPEIVDDFGSDAVSVDFEDGRIVLTFQRVEWEIEADLSISNDVSVIEDEPEVVTVTPFSIVPNEDDVA